mgnify:CR=1 FL=1
MTINNLDEETLCECTKALTLALGHKDLHTQLHSERVIELSQELGIACGLDSEEIKSLRVSAAFHDIGKIGIPDSILLKSSSFERDEWEIMQTHSARGEEIVEALRLKNNNLISKGVRHHHEYFNGEGYPDRLKGEDIPIMSRIISICDSYDGMASPRPYHQKRSHKEVLAVLQEEKGKKHDPEILDKFLELIETSSYKVS